MEIAAPFTQNGPIAGFDFIVDHKDVEDEWVEVLGDNDSNEDGETMPTTQSQPWSSQSQF